MTSQKRVTKAKYFANKQNITEGVADVLRQVTLIAALQSSLLT